MGRSWNLNYLVTVGMIMGLWAMWMAVPLPLNAAPQSRQKKSVAAKPGPVVPARTRPATAKPMPVRPKRPVKKAAAPSKKVDAPEETSAWDAVKDLQNQELDIEYKKPKRGARFAFNLVDADLIELIKIIGNITGKSFIIGGTVPKIKATIYAPTKITAQEAYHTFLSVLQVNGLTVMPSGRYLKIVPNKNAIAQTTPITNNVPNRDQIVTRLQPLTYVAADELATLLAKFKSPEGDVTVYAPTNTLIITDYGTSIRRLVRLIDLLDVAGTSEQIWVEPVNYASAEELASRIQEIFEIDAKKAAKAKKPARKGKKGKTASASIFDGEGAEDVQYSKVIADERTNSLIIVASEEGYLRILELVKVLDVPVAGEGTLHVIRLQHANSEELAKTLNSLAKAATKASKKGSAAAAQTELFEGDLNISADKATNSLVVVSSLRDYMSLKAVIDELDSMQRQVFVEAVIMEVSLDKNRKVGLGVHGGGMLGDGDNESLVYGISQPPGGPNSLFLDPASLTGLAAGVRGPDIPGSEEMVGVSIPGFGVALQALQQNSDVNVLSTPHILATDNAEASITVGENVPVLQGVNSGAAMLGLLGSSGASGANNLSGLMNSGSLSSLTSSYSRQDVGITLAITPHINDDNQVRLEVDLEISEVKSIDPTSGPTISKQNAKTTSVVSDQQTFVLGGLITDNQVETTTKVPVLGDIPLLGMLFRHKASITKKRNLLIFLTPYIIRSPADFREIFQRKMAERREFIERYTAFEYHRYDPHLDWSRTKGALSVINEVIGQAQDDSDLRKATGNKEVDPHSPKSPLNLSQKADEGDAAGGNDVVVAEPGKSAVEAQALGGVAGDEPVVTTNTGGKSE